MMQLTTNDGVQLSYHVQGNGQPLLFLAGYSGSQLEWQQQVPFFVERGYQVVTMDHRNHGQSFRTKKNLRIARLAVDCAQLIATLDLRQTVLIGHSMGAGVCWAYESLFGYQRLAAMVDVDESPLTLNNVNWPYGALDLTWENVRQQQKQIALTKMTWGQVNTEVWQSLKKQRQAHPFSHALNAPLLTDHLLQDWRDVVSTSPVPQLFLGSLHSPIWQPGYLDFCQAKAPTSTAHIFENSGHLPHLEEPDLFNQWVFNFLQTLS
ncbi:alpha/beta hydrolase [Bombilactobacillus folatiphilus]|uniref:Alpha/beta hydrolase n=1 Tax=Bombilactobacillus folatiphilus TaxID=2923362 RepID=A0ABY4P8J2_9LACO|nr:alpha/beta hydrolase [Bombilactobacillus folatiphilus]UQS81926.1 alpha/beta hydrolase [Bombilactobacillus folatiphilus]